MTRGAGKMTQLVKHLPGKHEDWNLDLQNRYTKYGMLAPVALELWDRDRRGPGASWPASLAELVSFKFRERSCLKI